MENEYPKIFARFYDLIYHQIRENVDNEFFLNKVKNAKGKVLEIGVGTGRFFAEALNFGADIYGIDVSGSMIDVLKSKLEINQYFRITKQSIVDFNFDFGFDLIIAPFRVLMHVLDKEKQLAAINNVFRHLNQGGMFIFDTFIPDLNQLIKGLENIRDFEAEYEPGKLIRRIVSTKPDLIKQLINITFRFEWEEENSTKSDEWNFQLRFIFRYEMEHLIERSKFSEYQIFGDYQGHELNQNSREFIVICSKH